MLQKKLCPTVHAERGRVCHGDLGDRALGCVWSCKTPRTLDQDHLVKSGVFLETNTKTIGATWPGRVYPR